MKETKTQHNQAAQDFLDSFDGDIQAAIRALHDTYNDHKAESTEKREIPRQSDRVIVSVSDVRKEYKIGKQKVPVLQGATLDIYEGEFVALTGASGSGKSTLLNLIGGLDKPTEGTITVDDLHIEKLKDSELSKFRNATIGFVFQFFYLQPFLRLGTNIEVPGMFGRIKSEERRERMKELADSVGLSDRVDHFPKELSGGQMQRAAIARALLNRPKILLADEPTGNLDSENSKSIISLLDTIRRKYGTTIVMVTHDRDIARHADREIVLKDGVVV
jgi:ABC-type lipoprotein export system ATPase subunit